MGFQVPMINLKLKILSAFNQALQPAIQSVSKVSDRLLQAEWDRLKAESLNPLQKAGAKYFSQSDEDGILLEILRRLGIQTGRFFEFGVGDGRENNSLILLAKGWKGVWSGGEDLCFMVPKSEKRFTFLKRWIDADNVVEIFRDGMERIGGGTPEVLSLDLDGNDLELARQILSQDIRPSVFIIEYNGRFPPGVEWEIAYDRAHIWNHDDYMGASLQSFTNLFEQHDYSLVACNLLTGANAFFVRSDLLASSFNDVPKGIEANFVPLRIHLFHSYGHPVSPRTIERIIALNEMRDASLLRS